MNTIKNVRKRELQFQYLDNHEDCKIVCFGASGALNIALEALWKMQIVPDFVCDNDVNKQGKDRGGYKISTPQEVFEQDFTFLVIISSMYSEEIKKQLAVYKNILHCEDYRTFLPAKIHRTDMVNRAQYLSTDIFLDKNISILQGDASKVELVEYPYINYLSYCNETIAQDRDENRLYLYESKYNFNELNVKKMLEYLIFRRYERDSKELIIVDSLYELNKGRLPEVLHETIRNLTDKKFEFIKATQSLTKRKPQALVWHLYHIDMFEQINEEMQDCVKLFDIYISINHECTLNDVKKVLSVYPSANIFMFENRGRDVLPFLKIFQKIEKLGYESLCKIHTKKSIHRKDGVDWGRVLRRRLFNGKDEIIKSFENDTEIGAYVAKGNLGGFDSIGLNKDNIKSACNLLNIAYTDDFCFPFGTMFWCKPEAICQLASKSFRSKYFVIENGEIDGTFAHAIERLVGLLIQHNGYRLLEI